MGRKVTRALNSNPMVEMVDIPDIQLYVYRGFLPEADCQILIDKIDEKAEPSSLYKGTEQEGFRTSYSCHLNRWESDIDRIEKRISALMGIDNDYAETMQGQRYQIGQEFKAHHDFFHPAQDYWKQEELRGGQRSWTAMIFLNNVPAGGATEFPHLKIGVRPERGTLLMWNNMAVDGKPNYKSLHSGTPVVEGTKYIITKWYRQNNWVKLTGSG
ncbi:hypothetical protein LPB140_04365 [Sphingorhabdus lutea]|uniref:Fe2OG dioxygenase domain-containing protein n=1 Tax=Sphingorhabdus lutea TaxID=1913578 RepID=A0A1L3JEL2_9SPHN|nr:hypothetical protein LPB140_04365 [Sphingorhabdus lutea]